MIETAIQDIVKSIPQGHLFDSHFVIGELLRHHSDEYLSFACSFSQGAFTTECFHGHIGQKIAALEGTLIARSEAKSWSHNIHGAASPCTSWKRT